MKNNMISNLKAQLCHKFRPEPQNQSPRSLKMTGIETQSQAFGDFFACDNHAVGVKAHRPSKYTSFCPSEGFKVEAEDIYISNLQKSATWKLDIRIIPVIGLLYFMSELGRLSLERARTLGLQESLEIHDLEFSLSLILTLIPLILVEMPSNFLLRRIGGRFFFSILSIVLGIITFCHGFIVNTPGLLMARFFFGLVNGGLFPGFLLYLSNLYERRHLQWRIGLFFSTSCLSGAFLGPLTCLMARLDGALGLKGWKWLFIIAGILTLLSGLLGFFVLPSSCEDAKFLTSEEKKAITSKLQSDRSPIAAGALLDSKPFRSSGFQIFQAIRSPHVALSCLAFFFAGVNITSLDYLQTIVVNALGSNPSISQIFSVPPYTLAFLTVLLSAYISDRFQARAMTAVVAGGVAAVGFTIFYIAANNYVKYWSLFLIVPGAYAVIASLAAWMSNNSESYARKATTLALGPVAGNLGGLISILLFRSSDASSDATASILNVTFSILGLLSSLTNVGYLTYAEGIKTHRRDEVLQKYSINDNMVDPSVQELLYLNGWEYLGDRHPDFRYLF